MESVALEVFKGGLPASLLFAHKPVIHACKRFTTIFILGEFCQLLLFRLSQDGSLSAGIWRGRSHFPVLVRRHGREKC